MLSANSKKPHQNPENISVESSLVRRPSPSFLDPLYAREEPSKKKGAAVHLAPIVSGADEYEDSFRNSP